LSAAGLAPQIITGGGTGTHQIDARLGVFNELQVVVRVHGSPYSDCDLRRNHGCSKALRRTQSLARSQGMATDSGFNRFHRWRRAYGRGRQNALFVFMGEHGA
jgi:hypothetical protein